MTTPAADDAASVVFTEVAESVFETESLYEEDNADEGSDYSRHTGGVGTVAATQAAKALEAATQQSHESNLEQDGPSNDDAGHVVVVLDAGPAPPDYAAATAGWRHPAPIRDSVVSQLEAGQSPADPTQDVEAQRPPQAEEHERELGSGLESGGQSGSGSQHVGDGTSTHDAGSTYQKLIDVVEPAVQTARKYVEPPLTKVITVITPPVRAVWLYVEPQVRKVTAAVEPAVQGARSRLGPPVEKVTQVVQPAILTAGKHTERRLKSIALAMEPRLHTAWSRAQPVCRKVALTMEPAAAAALAILVKIYHFFVNKHTIAIVRRHWLHIFLANVAFTFALLSLITFVKKPGYRQVEVFPEYYWTHPRRSYPARFHDYSWECPLNDYSDFSYTQWEHSGNFSLKEAIEPRAIMPGNFTLFGRIDIRPAPLKQNSPVEIWYSTASTWPWVVERTKITTNGDSVIVPSPRLSNADGLRRFTRYGRPQTPCISVFVGIYVNDKMQNFNISTRNFPVRVGDENDRVSWNLEVRENLHIAAGGRIQSDVMLDGRSIKLDSKAGGVSGKLKLRDYVHIDSAEGDLHATIEQEPPRRNRQGVVVTSELETSTFRGNTYVTVKPSEESESRDPYRWPLNESSPGSYLGLGKPGRPTKHLFPLAARHQSLFGNIWLRYEGRWQTPWDGTITGTITNGGFHFNGCFQGESEFPSSNLTQNGPVSYFKTHNKQSDSNMAFNVTSGDLWINVKSLH